MKGVYLKDVPEILQINGNKVLPTSLSLKLAKLNKEVYSNIEIYKEVLNKLLNNYAEKDSSGAPVIDKDGTVTLKNGCENKWKEEYKQLEESEFEIKTTFTEEEILQLELTPIQAAIMIELIKEPQS